MNGSAQAWLAANQKMFTPQHLAIIRSKMKDMDEDQIVAVSSVPLKNPTTMLLIEIFLGEFGVHRFMLGEVGMGLLELLTGGLCLILWVIDLFTVTNKTREYNYTNLLPFL